MRNLKKVLALASVMLMGMMVVGTSAASDAAGHANEEAIEVVKLIGVMAGDENGNFNPAKGVTRNEMAVIMANLLDLDIEDYKGATPFTDLAAWAEPYVAACYANGIVSGTNAMAGYVLTEANKSVAKYVVIANTAADIDEDVKFSTDLIYIKSAGTETGDGFVMQTVYFADGSKQDVKMDDAEYSQDALLDAQDPSGFYKYDINDDGFYTLQDCTNADILAPVQANNGVWKDEAGILENAAAVSLYEGMLTISNPALADIDVSAAKFVDAHSTTTQGQYDKAISSLANLIDLMDKNVVTGNTIQLNVAKDGAVVVILTSATIPQQNP